MQLQPTFLLMAFALSGITLKASDFLGEKGNAPLSYISATISAFVFGLLMSDSAFSSSFFLGLIIGVILSRKVDRPNMIVGLILTFIFAFYFGLQIPTPLLLIVVALFTLIDEVGHEKLAQKKGYLAFFFRYRLSLKLIMVLLAGIFLVRVIHLMGFLCFDLSYDLTNHFLTHDDSKPVKH